MPTIVVAFASGKVQARTVFSGLELEGRIPMPTRLLR